MIKRSEESERVSELKSVVGMEELPTDSLVNGAEGIKDMIKNFEEAYVEATSHVVKVYLSYPTAENRISRTSVCHQNCRDWQQGRAMSSNPPSPFEETPSPVPPKVSQRHSNESSLVLGAVDRRRTPCLASGSFGRVLPGWQGVATALVVLVLYVRIGRRTSEFVDGS